MLGVELQPSCNPGLLTPKLTLLSVQVVPTLTPGPQDTHTLQPMNCHPCSPQTTQTKQPTQAWYSRFTKLTQTLSSPPASESGTKPSSTRGGGHESQGSCTISYSGVRALPRFPATAVQASQSPLRSHTSSRPSYLEESLSLSLPTFKLGGLLLPYLTHQHPGC